MGKPIDERMIEYAYIERIIISHNVHKGISEEEKFTPSTNISLSIRYNLKDSKGFDLGNKDVNRKLFNGDGLKTSSEISKMICDNLENYINEDKQNISGFIVSSTDPKESPIAESPIAEEPIAEEPIAEEPIAEEPIAEEPIAEEPIAEEPIAEEPIVQEPSP